MGKLRRKIVNVSNSKQKGQRVAEEILNLQKQYPRIDPSAITTFRDFPLSENTQQGLRDSNYKIPTDIQKASIGQGLQGKDILGAAETGSGKTLAFLIPILECLYVKKWTRLDGVGAMIITPTRELGFQIFETLKKVGVHHDFSAGLVIGGKDLHFEKERMDQCNIVICTPGRILHHMDINPLFDCSSLQMLVLDEADRCLDMGFEKTMNSIIENLPTTRQTLLFSATQTKSVKELARLSLKTPAYVSVHENKKHTTPDTLEQSYVVCQLQDKINLLWSFVKNHRRQKILVFSSSCKQVKYLYSIFCRLRPGTPLLALYGTLHQLRRMNIYKEFCSKQNVVMFATDIASRGLDFPEVNWVVQMDCPEDANTYIHRAGRTARYRKGGESLLVLLPTEEKAMLKELESKRVPVTKIDVNQTKLMSPVRKIEALLARDPELKADAQRCFLAYVKSVYLMKNKDIFNVNNLNLQSFAASLGLAVTPRIRFLSKMQHDVIEREHGKTANDWESDNNITSLEGEQVEGVHNGNVTNECDANSDGFLTLKRKDHQLPADSLPVSEDERQLSKKQQKKAVVTKVAAAKKVLKKNIVANRKVIFTEDGDVIEQRGKEKFTEQAREYENEEVAGIDIVKARQILKAEDKFDKKLFRDRVKQKHKEAKNKLKLSHKLGGNDGGELSSDGDDGDDVPVRLGGSTSSDSESDYEPDTSWIPDPDKIYGTEPSSCAYAKVDSETEDDARSLEQPKRKKNPTATPMERKKRMKTVRGADDNFSTGLSLQEDEEIALKILQSAR